MNAQELSDAFRAVDPAWLKEADLLADRAAEQASCKDIQEDSGNEIQQIFAQHSNTAAKAASRSRTETKPEKPEEAFAPRNGEQPEIRAENSASRPVKRSDGLFRRLCGIAAALAVFSLGAFAASVFSTRNGGMQVQPAAQPEESCESSSQVPYSNQYGVTIDEDGYVHINNIDDGTIIESSSQVPYSNRNEISIDEDGNIIKNIGSVAYKISYNNHVLIDDSSMLILDDYSLSQRDSDRLIQKFYQPEGTPVELSLMPAHPNNFRSGYEYRILVQQNGKVLDITEEGSTESKKSLVFTSTDDYEENCKKISFTPDYSEDGSLVEVYVISTASSLGAQTTSHSTFKLFKDSEYRFKDD